MQYVQHKMVLYERKELTVDSIAFGLLHVITQPLGQLSVK